MAYLATLAEVKAAARVPSAIIDTLESQEPGLILQVALLMQGTEIDARLRKRYAPGTDTNEEVFLSPYPRAVIGWLGTLLRPEIYSLAGVPPSDQQQLKFAEDAKVARDQIAEAADSVIGKFDLTKRADTSESGIEQPTTLAGSEQSPFTGKHRQMDAVRNNRRYG